MKATDRNKLIDRIKTLEGLTADERAALLGLLNETKTYGLVWEDKPEEVEERLRMELPVLKEVRSRAIISDNADSPNHILIEGDNLEALTTLAYTHEGKIDVIYIDPPYNTGKKDFVYNDTFIDSEDSFRHSKWLSFISRRLKIAKKLLSDKGVIFLSIDDNEQASLKLLCDELFGESNFLGQLILKSGLERIRSYSHKLLITIILIKKEYTVVLVIRPTHIPADIHTILYIRLLDYHALNPLMGGDGLKLHS